jgi:hypothetical protein
LFLLIANRREDETGIGGQLGLNPFFLLDVCSLRVLIAVCPCRKRVGNTTGVLTLPFVLFLIRNSGIETYRKEEFP